MDTLIDKVFQQSIQTKKDFLSSQKKFLISAISAVCKTLKQGKKILLFGNGGSASDAQHIAAEFVGRFVKDRCPLPAMALTTDTSILTAIGNDYSFEDIFVRQIKALGKKGDLAWAISTSGNSPNVLKAIESARSLGMKTLGLTGRDGGKLVKMADISLIVPSKLTQRIQETHILIGHLICEVVDRELFGLDCD